MKSRAAKVKAHRCNFLDATILTMKTSKRYLVNLIFDPDYNGYVADVPQLPGCMSQGKSVEAALKNVRKAIAAYLKAAGSGSAKKLPEVLTGQVEVRV